MVVGGVVLVKGRNRQHQIGIEGVNPGEDGVAVGLTLAVAQGVAGRTPRGRQNLIPGGVGIRVDGNLVIILPQRSDQPKLVPGIGVEDEGGESSVAVFRIMKNLRDGGLEPVIAAVSVQADVVSKSLACVLRN